MAFADADTEARQAVPHAPRPVSVALQSVAQITPSGSAQSNPERSVPSGVLHQAAGSSTPEAPEQEPERGSGFLSDTLAELRKVVWPSRQQLFSESIAVILMVGLSAASIAALDRFYRWVSIQVFR